MAIVINPLLGEVRGKFGNAVFRHVRGKTTLSTMPWITKKRTPKQLELQDRFEKASRKARRIMVCKAMRAMYNERAGNKSCGFALLVKEIMKENAGI